MRTLGVLLPAVVNQRAAPFLKLNLESLW